MHSDVQPSPALRMIVCGRLPSDQDAGICRHRLLRRLPRATITAAQVQALSGLAAELAQLFL
jgi:hypothetical protein